MGDRSRVRELCAQGVKEGDPVGWFDRAYREAGGDAGRIPWDDGACNPLLAAEVTVRPGLRALDVGCGTGDNAAWLAARGARVTAFDVAPAGVEAARRRYPDADVAWAVADARRLPSAWAGAFDLVTEIYTLQTLPPEPRAEVARQLGRAVAPGGALFLLARAAPERGGDDSGDFPFPLRQGEVEGVAGGDLRLASLRRVTDGEGVERWVAWLRRDSGEDAVRRLLAEQVAAFRRGDLEAFCSVLSDDAVYVTSRGAVRGRRAIHDDYAARFRGPTPLDLEVVSVVETADTVTVVGRWSVGERGGSTLLVFRPTPEGWRLTHDATP